MAQTATMQAPAQGASDTKFSYPQTAQQSALSGPQNQAAQAAQANQSQVSSQQSAGQTPGSNTASGTAQQDGAKQEELFPNAKKAWFSYYRNHRNQVIFASVGLLVAAGFLIIGFWPTLLLAVFITAGVLYGRYKDGDRKTVATVQGIISRLD
ncbi:DUF2273 domain-containing protein [Raoultibacter phocaeensis]|uniref:DUF2273 domain-containing protein n=1 Tax=Raoultibacter phocaeensis TaxID=2479841 RepID=UPI001C5A5202|nr:DUF2273 domain-containing protein [Raoultibacter phocaeensis]